LVNNDCLLIADLGLPRQSEEIGMPAYIDPQCYIQNEYKRDKKSDIYSLGVLFWEISSGKPPFSGIPLFKINLEIIKGIREKPINNTPPGYQQLYENCWKEEPYQRYDIETVHRVLLQLGSQLNYQQIPQNDKFIKAINKIYPHNSAKILDLLMALSPEERTLCYFKSEYLDKKIVEANEALKSINDVEIPVVNNKIHDSEYIETENFMDAIKCKPIHEQKQKLGDRIFPSVKVIMQF